MDKLGADFYFTVDTIVNKLKAKPLVIQLPIGVENDFVGVVDLVEMRALVWAGDAKGDVTMGAKYEIQEIPADMADKVAEYRELLLETVAESDEVLLEKHFSGEGLTVAEIKAAIRKMTVNSELYPVLCGSAFKNRGVQPMLDAVVDYLPSPLDVPAIEAHDPKNEEIVIERHADREEPFTALAFKIVTHPFFGRLTYIRVYSGHLDSGGADRQLDEVQEGAHREDLPDVRQQGEPGRPRSPPVTSTRSSASRTRPRATRSPIRSTRSCSSR